MTAKILIVDDEKDIRSLIRGILEDENYAVSEAKSSTEAYEVIESSKPDIIILDIWLQGSEHDGLQILENIQKLDDVLPVLMISGHGTIETAVTAIKNGAYDFIEKPFKSDRLLLMIARALETAKLKRENRILKNRSDQQEHNLIGDTAVIKLLKQQIEKISQSNSRVFIKGEAGTGKEVVARTIHKKSPRHDQIFMAVNCAGLHPERLEEELFGIQTTEGIKKGVLELANGGTLFLDEIVDMPLETQGKILRVLQDNKFTPVGSHQPIGIDVRIISSTNQNVEDALKNGDFREDLLYRLNVVTLDLPPLVKRKDDIQLLAQNFLESFSKQTGQEIPTISNETAKIFKAYSWPGNVRQLRNTMEWIMIMNNYSENDNIIIPHHLPPDIYQRKNDESEGVSGAEKYTDYPLREAREGFERDYLSQQIARFNGNVSQTAEFIGMERSALHRKLKSLEISLQDAQDGKVGHNAVARTVSS